MPLSSILLYKCGVSYGPCGGSSSEWMWGLQHYLKWIYLTRYNAVDCSTRYPLWFALLSELIACSMSLSEPLQPLGESKTCIALQMILLSLRPPSLIIKSPTMKFQFHTPNWFFLLPHPLLLLNLLWYPSSPTRFRILVHLSFPMMEQAEKKSMRSQDAQGMF